jgi:phenylpyruvate tautomerase PptA (4-oxalocrotonate tautomerase family)
MRAISLIKEIFMPLSNVELIDGVLFASQKQPIVSKLTDPKVSVEGLESGDWGIGSKARTTADVNAPVTVTVAQPA